MEQSESIAELATALAQAQGELKNIVKSGEANYGKYAELGPTLEVVRPILAGHDLSIVQMPVLLDDGKDGLTTQLMHKSGQWIRTTMALLVERKTSQGQGSAITYARRYSLNAILALGSDDDDGQAASEGRPAQASTPQPPKPVAKASREQITEMLTAVRDATGLVERDDILKAFIQIIGYEPTKLSAANVPKALARIKKTGELRAAKQNQDEPKTVEVQPTTTVDDLDLPIAKADEPDKSDLLTAAQQAGLIATTKGITGLAEKQQITAFIEEVAEKPIGHVLKSELPELKERMKHRWMVRKTEA